MEMRQSKSVDIIKVNTFAEVRLKMSLCSVLHGGFGPRLPGRESGCQQRYKCQDQVSLNSKNFIQRPWLIRPAPSMRRSNISIRILGSSVATCFVDSCKTAAWQPDSIAPYIKIVHHAGATSAVWSIGKNAFCKVKEWIAGVTPEGDPSWFFGDSQVEPWTWPWPSLGSDWQGRYVKAVVEICKETMEWKRSALCGVDSKNIYERFLLKEPEGATE